MRSIVESLHSERASEPAPPAPTATASTPDPNAALFAEAHRLQFTEKDPARALLEALGGE